MAHKRNIPITTPSITAREVSLVSRAVRDGWGAKNGAYVKKFEEAFANYAGVKYSMATSSATGALHIAVRALGIGRGDEVIIPDITWISSASVVTNEGVRPVFADITQDTWTIDPDAIEKAVTKRTKAIMPVTLYGHAPDMTRIMKVARKHGLAVIEDAAQSVGSTHRGKRPGSFGEFGAFSFHGTKMMTTGWGGMLVTNDKKLFDKAKWISNQCVSANKLFWATGMGLTYKMTDIQAALGLAQLERVKTLTDKKRKIFTWYQKRLRDVPGITLNAERFGDRNSYWMTTVIVGKKYGVTKEILMERLKKYGIASRPFFYPLSSQAPFKQPVNNPVAYELSQYGINLPCGQNLTEGDVDYICTSLKAILHAKR